MSKNGDFTKPERDIREALFGVLYEEEWVLVYRKPVRNREQERQDSRWKFVDSVIDELRKQQRARINRLARQRPSNSYKRGRPPRKGSAKGADTPDRETGCRQRRKSA